MAEAVMAIPLSVLDLAPVASGSTPSQALRNTVDLARLADRLGYTRYWFAEHHNMPSIASSAPEVLIAHVAAATTRIRVGAGGIMLPEPRAAPRSSKRSTRSRRCTRAGSISGSAARPAPTRSPRRRCAPSTPSSSPPSSPS